MNLDLMKRPDSEEQRMHRLLRVLTKERKAKSKQEKLKLSRAHKMNPTEAEAKLLARLREKDIAAWFHPQSVMCGFILDFYCKKDRICIEVDGSSHWNASARAKDAARDAILKSAGIKVLRFTNDHVMGDIEDVAAKIKAAFGWRDRRESVEWFAKLPDE